MTDRTQTLEQLEKNKWGEPTYSSFLVKECHRLRKVALCELTVENLRILIGQNIGLKYLVPIALEILKEDPFVDGDYPGDLLRSVVSVEKQFWAEHQNEMLALGSVVDEIKKQIEMFTNEIEPKWMAIFTD